ncbi:hypothetical protein RYX36_011221 [Vicia faba]
MMNRKKQNNCWIHVTRVANGRLWKCNYCEFTFEGSTSASKVKAHLGLDGKTGNITPCSYDAHQQVLNNIASSSSENLSIRDRSIFESKINNLKGMVIDLECEENDIAKQTQWLESRGRKRKPEVDAWIKELHELKERVDAINNLDDMNELFKDMKRHKGEKPLTLSTEFVGKELDFNIKKVIQLLNDDQVFVIGIYGMGGVGKTLLATLVENEIKKKRTFNDVFWVTVSPNFTISKLQYDIAKRIGVELDEDNERIRANKLSTTLETKEKSVLILDDVWRYIDLEKVGVSTKVNGIKVILTTRLKHVCQQMDCLPSHMIKVIPLYDVDEGWELFKVKLGHYGTPATLSPEIETVARDIVDRLAGLPLGISVMARTMKGIDEIDQWKHSLNKLNKLEMGQEVIEEVFKVLKRSYDNLMEKDLRNCFLYCALLSSYEENDREETIMKLVDNGLINGNRCLQEIFDEGQTILDKLRSHSLMSGFDHSFEFNYRLVIDTACYIMKESKRNAMVKLGNELTKTNITHEWAADLEFVHMWADESNDIEEIPEGMSPYCPRLSTLIINQLAVQHIPESFFKCMNTLTILDLSYSKRLECLPNSISKMKSLVSLVLIECNSLKHVPPLGELKVLSRLVLSNCSIEELPQGLDKLQNLKWLDLSFNKSLNFELGSLNLTKIQYLDLQGTRTMITVEDIQRMTVLECFGGAFNCKHYNQYLEKYLGTRSRLQAYYLILGNVYGESRSVLRNDIYLKAFDPNDPEVMTILFRDCGHFSHILPKDLTCLNIDKNDHWVCLCDALSCNTSSSLKKVGAYNCQQLERLFCLSDSCSFCTKIHNLEMLELESLERLTVIDVNARQTWSLGGIFSCLKSIYVFECHLIEKLITPKLVGQVQNLEIISVGRCNSMKEILAVSDDIRLPKLKRLILDYLPQLKIVCKGSIYCGSLPPEFTISNCPSLERYPTIKKL